MTYALVSAGFLAVAVVAGILLARRAGKPGLRWAAVGIAAAGLIVLTAVFDSVVVIQPPAVGDRLPPMVVCGQISGKPGIGGRSTPTRFVYQTKFALFVEEAANRQAFADLVGRTCGATGARVVGP